MDKSVNNGHDCGKWRSGRRGLSVISNVRFADLQIGCCSCEVCYAAVRQCLLRLLDQGVSACFDAVMLLYPNISHSFSSMTPCSPTENVTRELLPPSSYLHPHFLNCYPQISPGNITPLSSPPAAAFIHLSIPRVVADRLSSIPSPFVGLPVKGFVCIPLPSWRRHQPPSTSAPAMASTGFSWAGRLFRH